MGARAALMDTMLPRISIDDLGQGQVEYDVNADEQEMEKLNIENVPLALTFYQVCLIQTLKFDGLKVGKEYVIDATHQEELCSDSKILIALDEKGRVASVCKSGSGGLSPSLLNDMVMVTFCINLLL